MHKRGGRWLALALVPMLSGCLGAVALPLVAGGAWLASLVKPQFEVGPARVVKGLVKDEAALAEACEAVRAAVAALGWRPLGIIPSPILGGGGAREFLLGARNA